MFALAMGAALGSSDAAANPNRGEARSPMRDADRVYTVVAGEADGSSTVQNPANLGYLRGLNFIGDVAWTSEASERRGSGFGTFIGIPIRRILSLGFGYQYLSPVVQVEDPPPTGNLRFADLPYSKFTMAMSIPLMRWVKGVSLGVNYSRLFSRENFWAADVNQVDVGISWWANRVVALAMSVRGLNQPRVGPDVVGVPGEPDDGMDATSSVAKLSPVLDPELALRPTGTGVLELGLGARIEPVPPGQARFRTQVVQPRARLVVRARGVQIFAEGEGYTYSFDDDLTDGSSQLALRLNAGLGFDLQHFGMAAGPTFGFASPSSGAHGGVGRIRISQERYVTAAAVRPRTVYRFPLAKYGGERGMFRLTREIEKLARRGASVLLLETKSNGFGYAQMEEVREALLRFRARGGKVVVYMDGANLKSYFLASAADRIISHPHTSLSIVGMAQRSLYYGDLIKRLGGNPEFIRIAEYKSTPEVYSRNTATEPSAKQRRQMMVDAWNHSLRLIARERGRDPDTVAAWVDEAPMRPDVALEKGIIDDIAWPDEIDENLEDWLGKKVRIESPPKRRKHRTDFGPQPQIAILYLDGDMVTGPSFTLPLPIVGRKFAGSDTLVKEIKKLRKDPNVRAIVLRINTRGGSVAAAAEIARELDLTADKKPVVVSFGRVAASGGYYVATAGDYIVTNSMTITGSIGIFYPKVDLSGFLKKFGVGIDISTLGANASLRSWFKPYSKEELAKAEEDMRDKYDIFTDRVAAARAMTPEQVDGVARGRIWAGVRAIDVGLADRYGGLREAIIRARRMAGMKTDEGDVVEYPPRPTLLQNVRTIFGLNLNLPIGQAEDDDADGGAQPLSLNPRLFGPLFSALQELPGAFWVSEGPEPLALDVYDVTLD